MNCMSFKFEGDRMSSLELSDIRTKTLIGPCQEAKVEEFRFC